MKKVIIYIGIVTLGFFSSCNDFLDTENPSKVDNNFVFETAFEANKVIIGAYEVFRASSGIHSNGLFYDMVSVSSDYELGPEMASSNARYNNENFYPNAVDINGGPSGSWNNMYLVINRCNIILDAFKKNAQYIADVEAGEITEMTHMYGEIAIMRAILYYELARAWGDVIYSVAPILTESDYADLTVTDRNEIQEGEIEHLKAVEPLMYYIGENSKDAERLTRGAAQAMIGRLALQRGGFALRKPTDDKSKFETPEYSDADWGFYGRRSDWKTWYQTANDYLKLAVNNSGARIITNAAGTGNAFQQVFQQMMNLQICEESIFEISETAGIQNERPYAFGRPSNGGSTAYPPKAYGQVRFLPWFFWGAFDTSDLRRDVTVAVTGPSGAGAEVLLPWNKGNMCAGGGISLNKWDYSRLTNLAVTAASQRKTGINAPYIRLADIYLLLAETEAMLGNVSTAKSYLETIRSRAFSQADQTIKVTNYLAALTTADQVMEAIQDERMFELAGEGMRKFDLVRWGILPAKVVEAQLEMDATINDLQSKGYREYANGLQFPTHIYTKTVSEAEMKTIGINDMLIGNTPTGLDKDSEAYAVQAPGWRGNTTDWSANLNYTALAIRGLDRYIADGSAEHARLISMGYARVPYGFYMLEYQGKNDPAPVDQRANWNASRTGTLGGYLYNIEYTAKKPVRYLQPIPAATIEYSNKQITNSYGFPDE